MAPFYIAEHPTKDPWGGNYLVYCGTACNGKYGLKGCTDNDFLIVCLGEDGKSEAWKYDPVAPQSGLYKLNSKEDLDKDLVNWNGSWIRAPWPEELRER